MRFQSAMIAVVVLAASLVIADDNLDESKAVEKIELLGGKIERDERFPTGPVVGVQLKGKTFNDENMRLLIAFPNLRRILLNSQITDDGLIELRELKNLKSLSLNQTQATDAGVEELQKALPKLKIHR